MTEEFKRMLYSLHLHTKKGRNAVQSESLQLVNTF